MGGISHSASKKRGTRNKAQKSHKRHWACELSSRMANASEGRVAHERRTEADERHRRSRAQLGEGCQEGEGSSHTSLRSRLDATAGGPGGGPPSGPCISARGGASRCFSNGAAESTRDKGPEDWGVPEGVRTGPSLAAAPSPTLRLSSLPAPPNSAEAL